MTKIAYDIGAQRITLEVRVSNAVAQNLYRKYGFTVVGTRRRYYSDNNEDAYIMTTEDINTQSYRALYTRLRRSFWSVLPPMNRLLHPLYSPGRITNCAASRPYM